MKRFSLFLLLPALLLATACNQTDRAKIKKNYVNSCLESARKTGGAGVPEEWLRESCDCAADRVVDNASDEELKALEHPDAATQQRSLELAQPCIDNLQKKVAAAQR